jgi:hypothetical protein
MFKYYDNIYNMFEVELIFQTFQKFSLSIKYIVRFQLQLVFLKCLFDILE